MKRITKEENYSGLLSDLASLIDHGRKTAVQYVNTALVATYWSIGRRIVEFEQKGRQRADYGIELLRTLSTDLTGRYGKGFGYANLNLMRQFFLTYPSQKILQTVSGESGSMLTLKESSAFSEGLPKRFILSWSHYCLLMRLDESLKRDFYEAECFRGNWSVKQLDRQIQSLLYERTALSKRKLAVLSKAHNKPIKLTPEDEIKGPYILEFLGLKDEYSETELEDTLIKYLEHFLLELGAGFTFVARQKRITLEGSHYRLDLLLYHRSLRCLVAVDLKVGAFSHADAGQMNLYLNYLKDKEKMSGENDPVGMILCTDAKKTVVEYALGGLSNKIFASRYKINLPDVKVLETKIDRERKRLLEMKIVQDQKSETDR